MHFSGGSNLVTEYTYDNIGNLTQDLNKNISGITYNSLNLPQTIIFSNGSSISYLYGTDGTMLQAKHTLESTVNTTDYCGTMVYQNGILASVLTEEGYVTLNGTTPTFHYYLKDHQGNNRVVINQNGTVEQVNHYYPFGALMAESSGQDLQPWKYGDKELDRTNGLDWYDFSARRMDPVLPGFKSVDPMAEKYYSLSPYTYCANNPVNAIAPTGLDKYQLNVVSRSLTLGRRTDDEFDEIEVGQYKLDVEGFMLGDDLFKFQVDESITPFKLEKNILPGTYSDISETGITVNNIQTGVDLMEFISMNVYKEISAWAFNNNAQEGIKLGEWKGNTFRSCHPVDFNTIKGDKLFYIHTHPGSKDGLGGSGIPSKADIKNRMSYAAYRHFILSKHDGLVEYKIKNIGYQVSKKRLHNSLKNKIRYEYK